MEAPHYQQVLEKYGAAVLEINRLGDAYAQVVVDMGQFRGQTVKAIFEGRGHDNRLLLQSLVARYLNCQKSPEAYEAFQFVDQLNQLSRCMNFEEGRSKMCDEALNWGTEVNIAKFQKNEARARLKRSS